MKLKYLNNFVTNKTYFLLTFYRHISKLNLLLVRKNSWLWSLLIIHVIYCIISVGCYSMWGVFVNLRFHFFLYGRNSQNRNLLQLFWIRLTYNKFRNFCQIFWFFHLPTSLKLLVCLIGPLRLWLNNNQVKKFRQSWGIKFQYGLYIYSKFGAR
jgi:hypothetical protein